MKTFCKSVILQTTLGLIQPAFAGFSLGQTRVIYSAADKTNEKKFIISPPVFKFFPGTQNTLLIKAIADGFPKDRESLFYVNVKAIPASDKSIKNQINFASKNTIKLIYRPTALTIKEAATAWQNIKLTAKNNTLHIDNPTPYIINFGYFFINNKPEDISYIYCLLPRKKSASRIKKNCTR